MPASRTTCRSWDWSSLFRPHVVGFLALPLDQGMAVRWWLPGLSPLIAAAYVFLVTLAPTAADHLGRSRSGDFFSPR